VTGEAERSESRARRQPDALMHCCYVGAMTGSMQALCQAGAGIVRSPVGGLAGLGVGRGGGAALCRGRR
jgi:hypothetical protein